MYAVTACRANGVQVPTFYLLEQVQGIVSPAGALQVAAEILFDRPIEYNGTQYVRQTSEFDASLECSDFSIYVARADNA